MSTLPEDRRMGCFDLSFRELEQDWKQFLPLMARVVVVKAEALWALDVIRYFALCDEFDQVPVGSEPPKYVVNGVRFGNKIVGFSFERSAV